jgi:recombinational DNA repair protein RecT
MEKKPMQVTKSHIDGLRPVAIAHDPAVKNQVINKMMLMYKMPEQEANRYYEREKDNFSKIVSQSPELSSCTPMSIYTAFMKAGALRLSFDNGKDAQIYLIPGNRNIGGKGKPDNWIKECVAQPTPYGEKEVRINSGILKSVGDPYIVHEGDVYKVWMDTDTGQKKVKWEEAEKKSTKIIGSFVRLVEPDGTVVFKTFDQTDIARWQAASAKKNKGSANALYTSGPDKQIDEGFLKAKTLLHSFKGYKRVDFAYSSPNGFVPDNDAAVTINSDYMDDVIDTEHEDVEVAEEVKDGFTEAVQEAPEVKESVQIDATDDENDLFNN